MGYLGYLQGVRVPSSYSMHRVSMNITLAVAANNEALLQQTLLSSPCFDGSRVDQVLIQKSFTSAAEAYNEALDRTRNDIVIFAHQDVYFPEPWLCELGDSLTYLEREDPEWGVLGCFGVSASEMRYGRVYSAGLGRIGNAIEHPTRVRTLDEIVLILRKSSGLRFDTTLPGFHFYGADICLRALSRGMNNYAIPAFCVHNTQLNPTLPPDFYHCYKYFKRVWRRSLPVHTSCITVSKLDIPFHMLRLREAYIKYLRRTPAVPTRLSDPRSVLE
jgi:Glycosyltransferase like family